MIAVSREPMGIATKGPDMKDDIETVCELLKSAAVARFRVLRVEGEEHPDRSWQRITCHEVATRWRNALKGKRHIRLVESRHAPTPASSNPRGGADGRWGEGHRELDQ